jgi:hypothetical protein
MASQALLFSEPSIAETCVWCELSEGIDPPEWAALCRYLGTLGMEEFGRVRGRIIPEPDRMGARVKRRRCRTDALVRIPLVSIGPSGIGGKYQKETVG